MIQYHIIEYLKINAKVYRSIIPLTIKHRIK